MNQVSEFSINQKFYPSTQQNSHTPQSYHSRQLGEKQIEVPTTVSAFQSNFKCTLCADHLSSLTQAKKQQILLEYQVEKLKEQIDKLKKQNQHLIQLQYSYHKANLQKYNPIMYFKEDLESELHEAKYLLQLHILSKSNDQNHIKPSSIKQSKKQKQFIQQISKPVDLKKKCQELLMENIKLQEKNMIKDKIIEERTLFPLFHYDQRILTLRKAVEFWYRKAQQETNKLAEVMADAKKYQKQLKKQVKIMVQQERVFWQGEIKKVLHQFGQMNISHQSQDNIKSSKAEISNSYDSYKNSHNQDHQKKNFSKTERQNILIEQDHTILSICQKMREKNAEKQKTTKRKSVAVVNANLCESCVMDEKNKSKITKGHKSVNKSAKNSDKEEKKQEQSKNEPKIQEMRKKTIRKENQSQAVNSSMMGKNFENIEIKLKEKYKYDDPHRKGKANGSPKPPHNHINCQRCAQRIL